MSGTKYFIGTASCVYCKRTRTTARRRVMSRKRTRVNHASQSLTLCVDSMEGFSRVVQVVSPDPTRWPKACRFLGPGVAAAVSSPPSDPRRNTLVCAAQLANQREQRQIHGNHDAADHDAEENDHRRFHRG